MKTLAIITLLALTSAVHAEEAHKHGKAIAGPKGGKVVEVAGGHAEFFVQPDRKVLVTFYGEDMKPVAPAEQLVTVIAEAPSGKAKMELEKTAEAFLSKETLPDGDGYRIVLQIKPTADGKAQNFRLDFHTETCGGCKLAEYACICESHGGGDGHGH